MNIMRPVIPLIFALFVSAPQAQVCLDTVEAVAPDGRYTDHSDGTVTDKITGLMWRQCGEGQSGTDCSGGSATTHTWRGALQIPASVNTQGGFAGYSDWRLPNIKELASLVEERCYSPAINLTLFPNTLSSYYWSASPYANYSAYAWSVYFNYGNDYYTQSVPTTYMSGWCVRDSDLGA